MEHFLSANGIDSNERKRAVFLSVIGPRIYKLLCSLVAPAKPGEKTFAELVAALTQHLAPKPSEIVQRYKFHTRFRRQGESVAVFVAELRALAQTCNFGDTLEVMLRDRLVCGMDEDFIQRRLLAELTREHLSWRWVWRWQLRMLGNCRQQLPVDKQWSISSV